MSKPWVIPIGGIRYLCWKDTKGKHKHKPLTREEENKYFTTSEQEKYLNELLSK